MYDMVSAILKEAEQKLLDAREELAKNGFAEAVYYAYTGFVTGAKALLLTKDVECNTQIKILQDFDRVFVASGELDWEGGFEDTVLSLKTTNQRRRLLPPMWSNLKPFCKRSAVTANRHPPTPW